MGKIICKYPKLLIIGQSFNWNSGGGITLTNLFKDWPRENIAVANSDLGMSQEKCRFHYIIGIDETRKRWPINLFQNDVKSEIRNPHKIKSTNFTSNHDSKPIDYRVKLKKVSKKTLNFLGVFLFFNKIKLSKRFLVFIEEFRPDIIYTQLASVAIINFIIEIQQKTKIPIVVHIMDDWPILLNNEGILGFFWNNYTHRRFKFLLKLTSLNLAISDEMAHEYSRRYNNKWYAYQNTASICIKEPSDIIVKDHDLSSFKIGYFGRIGTANKLSIVEFGKAVEKIDKNLKIKFYIYSPDSNQIEHENFKNVTLKKTVSYELVHYEMSKYDLLLLPLDFNKTSLRFSRYSLPTKAIDYMCSGVPIVIYAPIETAIVRYAKKLDFAYCITEKSIDSLLRGIIFLYNNREYLQNLRNKSVEVYKENHDPNVVRERFRQQLISLNSCNF